jgi:NAD-dependent SIR2 family protein deacetylase
VSEFSTSGGITRIVRAFGYSLQGLRAAFVHEAQAVGARTVEINLEPTPGPSGFDERIVGRASETVPRWVGQLLAGNS